MSPLPSTIAGTDTSLRDETPDDAAFAESLFASLHAPQMEAIGVPPGAIAMLLRQQYAMHRERERAEFPDAARWIIERDGHSVGRVCLDRGAEEHRLVEIVLTPHERGHGTGAAVIRAIQDDARAAGRDATLHVERGNPARRLYLRLGFEVVWDDGAMDFMRWKSRP